MMPQIFHSRMPGTVSASSLSLIFPITRHSVSKECNRIRTVSQTRKWEPRKGPKKRVDDREAELVSFANEISRRAARLERLQRAHDLDLPPVDWTRYHLQLLFVDRTDTVRARMAVGLFERVSEWNGYGRALYSAPCGVDAKEAQAADISTTVALMSQAKTLGVRPKLFAQGAERFEREDLDRYDLIVALDSGVKDDILSRGLDARDRDFYRGRVCLLTSFSTYCTRKEVLRSGGSAVLRPELSSLLGSGLAPARETVDIQRPSLQAGVDEWSPMVKAMIVACAGLVQYLIDACPPDLPEYDPV